MPTINQLIANPRVIQKARKKVIECWREQLREYAPDIVIGDSVDDSFNDGLDAVNDWLEDPANRQGIRDFIADLKGMANNTPFDGLPVQGRVIATMKGGRILR